MANERKCIDAAGERLNVEDKLIPIMSETCILGISGILSKIKYSEEYNTCYITIIDEYGKVLLENVNSRYQITKGRFNERENEKHIYSLTFYDNKCIPLTNKTNPNYEFLEGTTFISLTSDYKRRDGSHVRDDKYFFQLKIK